MLECAFCHNSIDRAAKLCVFCGANPRTGKRVDPAPLLESHFSRKEGLSSGEAFLDIMRKRQGIVLSLVVMTVFALAFGLHYMISERNAREVAYVPAIPLTEVADLSNQGAEGRETPIPDFDFQFDGNPKALQTYIVERGAIAPPAPPVVTSTAATTSTGTPAAVGSSPVPGQAQPPAAAAQPRQVFQGGQQIPPARMPQTQPVQQPAPPGRPLAPPARPR
ncbi:MAG TPA: hypothetical protein VNM92_09595 [Thermoanaerobaculia bacterium]|nr:hypothetical protein [Thermoanaerobaculia bacterium]